LIKADLRLGSYIGLKKNLYVYTCRLIRNIHQYEPLYDAIHRCIVCGFLSNIAIKKQNNMFLAAKNKEVMIFPGSSTFNKAPDWIVAAELVETTRRFARTVGFIRHEWLEYYGKNLCKKKYLSPHWDKKRGEVVADEQVFLFGLLIVTSGEKVYQNHRNKVYHYLKTTHLSNLAILLSHKSPIFI